MQLKPSNYNYIVKDDNGDYLVCNLIKGYQSLRRISSSDTDFVSLLSSADSLQCDYSDNIIQLFVDAGFLIDENENELFKIKVLYENKVYNNYLNLIIMTTGQCNFRCKYCYEDFKQGRMSEDTQKKVIKFIQKQLYYYPRISIEWFGGEPLVEKSVIDYVMPQVKTMCSKRKSVFRAGITTNGYLLTPTVFDQLYHMNVFQYQITLDGSKNDHNNQRVLADGSGTFDVIMDNLLFIKNNQQYSKASIILRINLTKPIVENLQDFLELYKQNFGNDKRFSLAFKAAGNLGTKDISAFEDNLLTNQQGGTHDILKQLGLLNSTDYNLNTALDVLTPMSSLCYASMRNSYVIGPDGAVYKCTVHFNEKINQIGYIDDNGNMVLNNYLHSRWYSKEFSPSPQCIECKFLPVCYGGGCTYYANFKPTTGCYSSDLKRHIEDYMKYISRFMNVKEIKGL